MLKGIYTFQSNVCCYPEDVKSALNYILHLFKQLVEARSAGAGLACLQSVSPPENIWCIMKQNLNFKKRARAFQQLESLYQITMGQATGLLSSQTFIDCC